jgi:hypothetical protein
MGVESPGGGAGSLGGRDLAGGFEGGAKFRLFDLHIRSISDVFFRLNFQLTRRNYEDPKSVNHPLQH